MNGFIFVFVGVVASTLIPMVVELSDLVLIPYDRFASVLFPLVVSLSTLVEDFVPVLAASCFPVSIPVIVPVYVVSPLFLVELSDLVLIPYDRFALVFVAAVLVLRDLVLFVMVVPLSIPAIVPVSVVSPLFLVELSDLVLIPYDRFALVFVAMVPVFVALVAALFVMLVGMSPMSMTPMSA